MAPLPELQDDGQANDASVQEDANQDLYESDEFRMYCYKVLPCAKRASHEWTSCPFSHPNEKARRRDPRIYKYLAIPCPDTKEGKTCPRGDDCPNCHSLFEYWLHPSRYRTQLCRNNDGSACRRQICFFAHSIEELRVPDHSHLNIPEELLQKQASLGSNDGSAAAGDSSSQDGSSSGGHAGASCEHSAPRGDKAAGAANSNAGSKQRRGSKASTSSADASSAGRTGGRQCAPSPAASSGGLVTTTSGSLPSNLDLPALPPSPCGPLTPMPLLSSNSLGRPYASALHAGAYGGSSWSAGAGPYLPRSASLDQQLYDGLGCFSAPGTPAAALRRGSLDLASCRTSVDLPPSGRCSGHRPASFDLPPPAAASSSSSSRLFSSQSMMGDPEVPDPCCSPRSAAMQQLKQQQMWALQQEQLEAAVGAALSYEQQVMQLQLNQQQQAAWFAGRAAAAATMAGEFGGPGVGSPPLSPAPSSIVGSRASLSADELFAGYSPAASSIGSSAAACWGPPPHGLPRTLSGPAGCQPGKGFAPGRPPFRYGSLDAPQVAAAAAAAASSAAEVAGQVQMAALQRAASMGAGSPQYSMAAPLPPQQQPQQRMRGQGDAAGAAISLAEVAELVDSVNRGDLGEAGNQVLNGVISLLMQQLQQQQLAA